MCHKQIKTEHYHLFQPNITPLIYSLSLPYPKVFVSPPPPRQISRYTPENPQNRPKYVDEKPMKEK